MTRRALLPVLAALALAGCAQPSGVPEAGDVAISLVDGELAVVTCDPLEDVRAYGVQARGDGLSLTYVQQVALLLSTGTSIPRGFEYRVGDTIPGMTLTESASLDQLRAATVTVTVNTWDGEHDSTPALRTVRIPEGGLQDGSWVRHDGSATVEPCPAP